ncbi:MAG TPA: hypothetical protein VFK05_04285 [Polyangiaceae bacterium]|nr:hypothetical protein [Polyangiaceae bacterium]
MTMSRCRSNGQGPRDFALALGLTTLVFSLGCSETKTDEGESPGPFKSLEAVANAPRAFSAPRAGVPLADGSVAFIATLEGQPSDELSESGKRSAVLLQPPGKADIRTLYSGDLLVNPLDIALSVDESTLYIADPAAGEDGLGALLSLDMSGGEPSVVLAGSRPRAVTVSDQGETYFSGSSDDNHEPGVFLLSGSSATAVFTGPPLVDPSGIAVRKDGTLLVADTRSFDGDPELGNEAGIVRISGGQASIWASGFATGYPAGIALTLDEKTLIISGEGPGRSDTVYLVDTDTPTLPPGVVTASFSAYQDSSAGLKRAHGSNTFIWASLAAEGGTVYRIVAN